MLYVAFFCAIFLLLIGLLGIPFEKKNQVKRRVDLLFQDQTGGDPALLGNVDRGAEKESFKKRVLTPLWLDAKKKLSKRMGRNLADKLEKKLNQAGNPYQMKAADYRIVQLVFMIGMPVLALGYGWILGIKGGILLMFPAIGLGLGALLPHRFIKIKIQNRQKQAVKELPDFVDLLLVSLEAGLGFDGALSKVIGKQEGVLSKEFRRCLEELRLGLTRKEALAGVRDRLEVEEISVFINSVLRAEKLGVGMVQVLRILSVDVREQRRQRAEEIAMKAPIKILFPLVFFIFPSLFIVILGPVVIQMIQQFK